MAREERSMTNRDEAYAVDLGPRDGIWDWEGTVVGTVHHWMTIYNHDFYLFLD